MLTAIVGCNWGDEGKGRMVDLFSQNYDTVVRYQGGNNAGHTVINDKGKFILNLLPSGILQEGTTNILGTGMVVDIQHLCKEIETLQKSNIDISPKNLKISDKATICMPYHVLLDCLEEDRLKDSKFGSTRRGIAPVYADKYMKKTLRMGDLFHIDQLTKKIEQIVEWKNLTVANGYGAEKIKAKDIIDWLKKYGEILTPYICDTTEFLEKEVEDKKNIMFEAQLGALRDIDYGIFPYTSSSSTLAGYSTLGAGIPFAKLDNVIGIMKAYSSCVGEGPFTVEMFGEEANELRIAGGEFGAATGRPRRVGAFDCVASAYGTMMQGATEIALTKLDVLSYMKKIPVCVAYKTGDKITKRFPSGEVLEKAEPIIEYFDGFCQDISACRKWEDLPENAQKYIKFIEKEVGVKIKYVSVGAKREEFIEL